MAFSRPTSPCSFLKGDGLTAAMAGIGMAFHTNLLIRLRAAAQGLGELVELVLEEIRQLRRAELERDRRLREAHIENRPSVNAFGSCG